MSSQRTEQAVQHLRSLKPYDGWSVEAYTNSLGKDLVVLKRRNASLSNSGFEGLLYDENGTKCIIGITHEIGSTEKSSFVRGVVLVEKNGTVAREQREIRTTIKKGSSSDSGKNAKDLPKVDAKNKTEGRSQQRGSGRENMGSANATRNAPSDLNPLNDEQTSEVVKLGLIFIGAVTLIRMIASIFTSIYVIIVPLALLYAMQTCPSNEIFDAKKELKRVLRGAHLPDNHPSKAKDDWLSNTVARVTASVTAEVATALGHEISFVNFFGICTMVTVTVPSMSLELYWIGIFGKWTYLVKRDIPMNERD